MYISQEVRLGIVPVTLTVRFYTPLSVLMYEGVAPTVQFSRFIDLTMPIL